jgi:6-phosphogluconolactonase (cycloisomerase 2 family)
MYRGVQRENKRSMRTRFTWVLGILALIAIGLLIACSAKYSTTSDGLVVVPSQLNNVVETFSLNLSNGDVSQINNVNGPPTPGLPLAIVLDPAGAFAYVLVTQNSQITPSMTGIASFPIASDGKLSAASSTVGFHPSGSVAVAPAAMVIDSAGKFLFVANNATTDSSGNLVAGPVSVFSVNNGTVTEVAGSPFSVPLGAEGPANLTAVAVSPTAFPPFFAACSGIAAPTSENLYVTDAENNMVWEFGVSSSGALGSPPGDQTVLGFATGTVPSGVAIDPCNRFAYVANAHPDNNVSAFTVCNAVRIPTCMVADGSLVSVSGSFPTQGFDPGPLTEDPYGNFLYVVNRSSNSVSDFKIGTTTGGLTALNPAFVATGVQPVSIAVRSDDVWLFVPNFASASVSQYSITPATGQLSSQPAFETDDNPFGVAVK